LKILIEPSRFKNFLTSLMIYKSKPLIESVAAVFGEKGVTVKEMDREETVAVIALYPAKYFLEYEAN